MSTFIAQIEVYGNKSMLAKAVEKGVLADGEASPTFPAELPVYDENWVEELTKLVKPAGKAQEGSFREKYDNGSNTSADYNFYWWAIKHYCDKLRAKNKASSVEKPPTKDAMFAFLQKLAASGDLALLQKWQAEVKDENWIEVNAIMNA